MTELQDEQLKDPEHGDKKPLRIIHIEDDEEMRGLIEEEVKKFPDVEFIASFPSTKEAKDYLLKLRSENKELPDGIVSDNDLGFGKTTGIQFAKELKKLGFEIPVVLFTGYAKELRSLSEEYLDGIGVKSIVDKNALESTENLVGILKEIGLSSNMPQNKPQ